MRYIDGCSPCNLKEKKNKEIFLKKTFKPGHKVFNWIWNQENKEKDKKHIFVKDKANALCDKRKARLSYDTLREFW